LLQLYGKKKAKPLHSRIEETSKLFWTLYENKLASLRKKSRMFMIRKHKEELPV